MSTIELKFQRVPQNDRVAIRYVKVDYESGSAKGLVHGLQKDAIQNSVGAAKNIKNLKSWEITFDLLSINGNDALSFTDKGTIGLTGDILSNQEIIEKSSKGELDSTQNLSRFLSVFESGGNLGPGSYGRGKLVFQACSKTQTILCDSLRNDDTYIFFKRTIKNNQLVQTEVVQGREAEDLLAQESDGKLSPLKEHGTRITILDLDPSEEYNGVSIKQAIINSFDDDLEDEECEYSFDKMIQETWWELLLKTQAKFILKWEGKIKTVTLEDPLLSMLVKNDKEDGWRIHERKNINIQIKNSVYRIKRLRFAVAPFKLPDLYKEIYVQRKRMKIGEINKNINPDNKIKSKFTGIIELDKDLEEIMLEPEDMTHYGYKKTRHAAVREIRQVIKEELESFHEKLGIRKNKGDKNLEREIQEALKELNEHASEFGLISNFGTGREAKQLSIKFKEFQLPNKGSLRVEYIDDIGPIKCEIINSANEIFSGEFRGKVVQRGNGHEQQIITNKITIPPRGKIEIDIPPFKIDQHFHYGEGIMLRFELPEQRIKNTKLVWLGREAPVHENKYPFQLTLDSIQFPHKNTRRVEINDKMENIGFSISNTLGENIKTKIQLTVRRGSGDKSEIIKIIDLKDFEVKTMTDEAFQNNELLVSEEHFGFFNEEPLNHDYRSCELYLRITSAEHYVDLGILKGDYLAPKKKIPFWIGIDDPGQSVFIDVITENSEKDHRRSWFSGNKGSGYYFHFNQGHPAFKIIQELDSDGELKNNYYKEEGLKQAYTISLQNEVYKGLFMELATGGESYAELFKQDLSIDESVITYEELLGMALHKIYV